MLLLVIVFSTPLLLGMNTQHGLCLIMFLTELNKKLFLMDTAAFILLSGYALYYVSSFLLLPTFGILMSIKVISIRRASRRLTKKSHCNLSKERSEDIRVAISQIIVSIFALIFNLPMLIVSYFNLGT